MLNRNYIWIGAMWLAMSCAGTSESDDEIVAQADTTSLPNVVSKKDVQLNINDVQVLTARKVRDPHSNYFKEYKALCKGWKPSKAVVTEIFSKCKIIDGHEYHYYYEILPCYVIGRLIINCDITAKYELNAGGSAILLLPDTAYFVGYYGNEHFLTYRAEY